jgi:hypothetical protein
MVRRMAFMLALMPLSAGAQQVFKCVDGDAVSYQSAPCGPRQATEKAWEHVSYEPPSEADQRRLQAQRTSQARDRTTAASSRPGRSRASTAGESAIGRCERAKARRDRDMYEAGVRKSMQKLRSWDAYVADACRP